jgi:DNA (cytosine-5)-methyltransferase 1
MTLRVLELFAGIGAASKALENLGIDHEIVDAVEIDKYAVKSFNAVHGTNFEPQDITKWDKDIECDLIIHGSPCQDFSVAGKQAGGDKDSGTRSSLMYETIRIVAKTKPKYVIWENVKNLLSKKHRHNFDAYLETMEKLGYTNYYKVLNAADYGVPQHRERVFTVSIREREYVWPEPMPLETKLKDILEKDVDEKYYISDAMLGYFMGVNQKESKFPRQERFLSNVGRKNQDVANSITTNAGQRPTDNFIIEDFYKSRPPRDYHEVSPTIRAERVGLKVVEPFCVASRGRNPENPSDRTPGQKLEQRLEPKFDGTTNTITTVQKDNYVAIPNLKTRLCNELVRRGVVKGGEIINHSYTTSAQRDTLDKYIETTDGTTPTLTTRPDILGYVEDAPLRIRKLTPLETWKLMGFGEEDFRKAEKVNSNAQLYKQAGNSLVTTVIGAIMLNMGLGKKRWDELSLDERISLCKKFYCKEKNI